MANRKKNDSAEIRNSGPAEGIEGGIGIRLKAAREAKGISQSDLHAKTGLSRTVLINYEAGRHKPGTRELRLLCDALEVSPNYLIYGTEETRHKSDSLADVVFSYGDAAFFHFITVIPMAVMTLGKDDIRAILNITESLLKAKDPAGYAEFMEMLKDIKVSPKGAELMDVLSLVGGDTQALLKKDLEEKSLSQSNKGSSSS